ncbi:MAG: ABC transporter permease [Elusimicrobia bacterium]|nr:ABC transporter permease [Candidatus Obscuribacterium magneticum]
MPAELYIARRYLTNRGHGTWGWLISWISTGSVALGVAALIITLAVMTGFREDIQQKILGVQPHVIITSPIGGLDHTRETLNKLLSDRKGILAWSPFINGQVLMGRGSQSSGAVIKGIDPVGEQKVAAINDKLMSGQWSDLDIDRTNNEKPRIILGQELARNLGARKGDTIWAMTPGSLGLTALTIPRAHLFIVSGIVQTGLYDYDSSLAYVDLASAQSVFDMKKSVTGVGIRIQNPEEADRMARELQTEFAGAYWVRSWLSLNRNLFSALKLEKTVMFIILTLITLVSAFMIVSNLLLIIAQKVREIGILRAMGATAGTIRRIFLLNGLIMGFIGTAVGTGLGVAISLILAKTQWIRLPADVYYIDKLPVRIAFTDVLSVVLAAVAIVFFATLYPSHKSTEVDPIEAIRYG